MEPQRVVVVAAHPDDESIGAGVFLAHARQAHVVLLTDGAPRERRLWPSCLPPGVSRETYASIRRQEVIAALAMANVYGARVHSLGFADQEAVWHLAELTLALEAHLDLLEPDLVITHSHEGGHPDHDAAAFAARAAVRRRGGPALLEMTSYHQGPAGLATGAFLPASTPVDPRPLGAADRELKRAMLDCFATQRDVIAAFGLDREPLRPVPPADFTRPPHAGVLYYERMGWMQGTTFRLLAAGALRDLGLPCA